MTGPPPPPPELGSGYDQSAPFPPRRAPIPDAAPRTPKQRASLHHHMRRAMRSFTPLGDPPGSAQRRSNFRSSSNSSAGDVLRSGQASLRDSRVSMLRTASSSNQPSYSLLAGESLAAPPGEANSNHTYMAHSGSPSQLPGRPRANTNFSRESSKENMAPPDAAEYETQRRRVEELKAEVGTLRYALHSQEQDRELARLQAENDVRDSRRQAEEDFRARQVAEGDKARAVRQVEALQAELEATRAEREQQRKDFEGKARDAQEEARVLHEQLEDVAAAKDEAARLAEREVADLRSRMATVERANQELEGASRAREALLDSVQTRLAEREETIGHLEADVLRLKAQTGDAETMAVIKRDLADQVRHIRALEATNREQLSELKHLRHTHRAVEIVEEEKRTLQRKLEAAEKVEIELGEERRKRMYLEEERQAWASYLQRECDTGDEKLDSPEAVARALVAERIQSAQLTHQLGELRPEVMDRDNTITVLENDKVRLQEEVEKLKAQVAAGGGAGGASAGADRASQRIERQRALAAKEVEYLRAQLKTFDDEDMTFQPESHDGQKLQRIRELENLVDQYKTEVNVLHEELSTADSKAASKLAPPATGAKRQREPEDDAAVERLGELTRKNRKLQDELSGLQMSHELLKREHEVSMGQLSAAREQLKTRILALRSNPTSDHEAVQASTLAALKKENAELLAHIQQGGGNSSSSSSTIATSRTGSRSQQQPKFATVPMSQLAAAQRDVADARAETASAQKQARRLKEVWAAKSAEFREAVFSTLGWNVSFIPGGKMRLESVYHPSADPDEHENSIVFDGERGTMKVGGGPHSAFAARIADNIKYWVREKGCVSCFLAALTLEFYEDQTKAVGGE